VEQNGQIYYYHKDGLGSITDITDASGNIVGSYTYKSFGEVYLASVGLAQPYMYTGREYDPESGLYYYRARYYDPKEGRFLTKDPIGFAGGDVNLYRYVQNNPVNFIDPFGLMHQGFINQLLKYSNKELQKAIKSLTKNIEKHEAKSCSSHHEHEIRVFEEQLRLAKEEAKRRGLMAIGGANLGGSDFYENISEEEAEKRTKSWFDWLDPFWSPGYAY